MRAAPIDVPHRPAIDGVRAIAVVAVVLYHADVLWLPAGFLGVDVFFTISGYLICSLLLAEWHRTGTISLRHFWLRRARRLFPAVAALLVGVVVAALVAAPDALERLRGDVVAAMAYGSNWWQIVRGESYFESFGRPPLLRHLWSLAVEEQFYVVFPLVMAGALKLVGRRRGVLVAGALAVGGVSSLLMALWWQAGTDPSRVYFGTDTRAVGLCAGVALALVWRPGQLRADIDARAARLLDAIGVGALAALLVLMTRMDEYGSALYRGGFVATAVASALLVAVAAHPASRLGAVLGRQPFQWIGTRSYAIYLWHWPVMMLSRPELDTGLTGWRLMVVRLVITAALAEFSWWFVEWPFRSGVAQARWRDRTPVGRARLGFVAAAACVPLVAGLVTASPPEPPPLLATAAAAETTETTLVAIPPPQPTPTTAAPLVFFAPPPAAPEPASAPAPAPPPAPVAAPAPAPTSPPAPRPGPPPPPAGTVLAVGDSVMLAAKQALVDASGGRVLVDAAVARQADEGLDVLQRYRDMGGLMNVSAVVVHLGTNGPIGPNHIARLAELTRGVPRVVVVNVKVPKRWEEQSNATIRDHVPQHPTMRQAGWHAAASQPGVLSYDGVHPTKDGARVYANVVLEHLRDLEPPPPPPTTAPPPASTPPP